MHTRSVALLLAALGCSIILGCTPVHANAQPDSAMPTYFIAIHCEPESTHQYPVLQEMVAYADAYNIKLTIMLTAQWADYIALDATRLAEVQGWMENGHEIAGHHHSLYHGSWDGYTDFSQKAVEGAGNSYSDHLGTLDDYYAALQQVNAGVVAGCVNDEQSKQAMPDGIVYDTCSGFANVGEPGTRLGDKDAQKGVNEYVTVGEVNGIERKWLAHYQVYQNPPAAMAAVEGMDGGIYGVVTHAARGQDAPLYAFMDFLHERDPEGVLSYTVTTAIEAHLIPEVALSDEIIHAEYDDSRSSDRTIPCGDGVCDARERANPALCPLDCEGILAPTDLSPARPPATRGRPR